MSAADIKTAIGETEEKIRRARELGDDQLVTWFEQDLRIAEAALARRNGSPPGTEIPRSPIVVKISDVQREEVTWLWQDRIPNGKLTMVQGDPGLGKSWLTLAIAAAVSTGDRLPGDSPHQPGNVVLMSAEDGLGDTIRPRLEDMAADLTRITALRGMINDEGKPDVLTLADLDVVETVLGAEKPRLMIIDPVISFAAGRDTSKANEVRGMLSPLAGLAEKHGCAIVAVLHLNKGAAKALYRGQGSIDFLAAVRSAFVVGEHPDDPEDRVLCHLKTNLTKKTPSLVFSIRTGIFGWKGESELTADQVLAVPGDDEKRTEHDDAKDFLKTILQNGATPAADVQKEAGRIGISERTLWRAKTTLKVKAARKGFGRNGVWFWSLGNGTEQHSPPDSPSKSAISPGVAEVAAYGEGGSLWEPVE